MQLVIHKLSISKFATEMVLGGRNAAQEELGSILKQMIHHHTLQGKFSSLHSELKPEGIIKVEVGEEGFRFNRDSGAIFFLCIV